MTWLDEVSKRLKGAGEFPAYERAVQFARGADIMQPRAAPIPLHNRVLPTQRDLCRLWLMSWRRDLDLRIESHKTWYRDRVLDEQAMRREGQYA